MGEIDYRKGLKEEGEKGRSTIRKRKSVWHDEGEWVRMRNNEGKLGRMRKNEELWGRQRENEE